jgi:hypothetical protein
MEIIAKEIFHIVMTLLGAFTVALIGIYLKEK